MKLNLENQTFEKLKVISSAGLDKHGKTKWKCLCECGSEVYVAAGDLRSGNTKSCGCMKLSALKDYVETKKANAFVSKHKRARSSWRWMIQRCTNPENKDYPDYGGRGINVCHAWFVFENFLNDMGDPPDGHTIDRIDTNGNYEPRNCRWSTPTEQARNTRKNVLVDFNGKKMTVAEAAGLSGIPAPTIYSRVSRGADPFPKEFA